MQSHDTETNCAAGRMAAWRANGGAAGDDGLAAVAYTSYPYCADDGLTAFGLSRGGIQACAEDGLQFD